MHVAHTHWIMEEKIDTLEREIKSLVEEISAMDKEVDDVVVDQEGVQLLYVPVNELDIAFTVEVVPDEVPLVDPIRRSGILSQ